MKVYVKTKYLIFPVHTLAATKTLTLFCEGKKEYSLKIRLDNRDPDFYAHIDVSAYRGKTLTLTVEPEMELKFVESDEELLPDLYREPYRPQVHFSPKNGWNNDPNGMIYISGEYHMFFQYNPCENKWNNMHWGHAVSRDLLHWEEKDIALFPDETGTMFSGCAVLDEKNLLGLQEGDTPTVALFYTATSPFSQYLAYSTDALKTVKKRGGGPILPHIVGSNRDPYVIFCEEWNAYAMALYLEQNRFGLYRSEDLIHWSPVQEIEIPGDIECPNLFPIVAEDGRRRWILMACEDRYLVGDMTGDAFRPIQEARSLLYGRGAKAGQVIAGEKDGRRIRIDWDKWSLPTPRIGGQMGFPRELFLKKDGSLYTLCTEPIREIEKLYDGSETRPSFTVSREKAEKIPLAPAPTFLKMKIFPEDTARLTMRIFGVRIALDASENSVRVIGGNAKLDGEPFPASLVGKGWELSLLVDRCSVEIYLDGGRVFYSLTDRITYSDYNLPYLELSATADCTVKELEIHPLKSIWES